MHSSETRPIYPALSVFIGATLWGVVWYPMRLLEEGGLQGIWLTLILYGAALAASLPVTYRAVAQVAHAPCWLLLLAAAAGWTNIAFVEAVLHGNILRVLLLFYLSPLWATLMGWAFLREHVSRIAGTSLVIALAGALLMLWNPDIGAPWPQSQADWFALSAGFAFAVSNVATRGVQSVSVGTKLFCVGFGVSAMAAVIIVFLDAPIPRVAPSIFGGAVALGVFGILVMTLLVQYGVTHIPVHRSAVITFVELVAGALSQALLTDEVVTAREWLGGVLIVLGAFLAARAAARH
ncbi:MAG TPA: DMT family transporter [Burkholderiales bacterium]